MKTISTLIMLVTFATANSQNFDKWFYDKTLRLDYIIAGNFEKTDIYFEQIKEETYWGGSTVNLTDKFRFGDYMLEVYDKETQTLIYSKGYSSIFIEWIFTDEAKQIKRSWYESVTMPFPKKPVKAVISQRNMQNVFSEIFSMEINPENYNIIKDKNTKYTTQKLHYSGDHHKKLDIVIIPDGYTAAEADKFTSDCNRFIQYFFEVDPFSQNTDKVNFWAVNAFSEESGTDIPGENIWKNTILNTHFYTFGSERYLTTQDIKSVRDIAAYAPYDQIYILVNTPKYGGGGVYNYYNLCSADHPQSAQVFTHEFGHAFAALADEYEYGYETADQLYDMSVEPWQVNITNLVNFKSKWENICQKQTPIPTPDTEQYADKIGAFEGAGYVKKGIYRPAKDCKMRSNNTDKFCPVCYKTVNEMLKFYSE